MNLREAFDEAAAENLRVAIHFAMRDSRQLLFVAPMCREPE